VEPVDTSFIIQKNQHSYVVYRSKYGGIHSIDGFDEEYTRVKIEEEKPRPKLNTLKPKSFFR
jgi:hypothetical protein